MKARIQNAVILAAGRGRRMMPLTEALPKPMAPYQNSTLIAFGILQVRRYIPHIHVTVGYKGAMLAQHLIEQDVSTVLNTEGRSNSWWIHNSVLSNLDEPVFVLTCDNVTDLDFASLERDYFDCGSPACMLVPVEPVPGLAGDYIFRDKNRVNSISRTEKSDIYCSGIQVLNPRRVNQLVGETEDFYGVWNGLIAKRELAVSSVFPANWFSVDTLADLERAGNSVNHGKAP